MKEPKRLLSHGASDFERQLLRAVATERPSALLRSRMQRSLGLVGPLAWASNVKAMFGSMGRKVAVGAAAAGVVVAGGVAAYQLMPRDAAPSGASPNDEAPSMVAPAVIETPAPEAPAVVEAHAVEPAAPPSSAPAADDSEDGRLREEIALLDSVKAALQRGERDQARHSLDTYRERFPDGILRREANVLRQRAEPK